ncbi:hypothetical protein EKH55_4545 [Sinorhizobium alkalisoli]|nr:hypothetical protein EKH55_4545 [Sinorhizobium alkalisoli]
MSILNLRCCRSVQQRRVALQDEPRIEKRYHKPRTMGSDQLLMTVNRSRAIARGYYARPNPS